MKRSQGAAVATARPAPQPPAILCIVCGQPVDFDDRVRLYGAVAADSPDREPLYFTYSHFGCQLIPPQAGA